MNKLISTQNGGIPLDWNDIRFEQDAVREAFYGILSALGITPAQSFILSGCAIVGSNITAGYIAKGGEVYQVDAQAIPTPGSGQYVYFNIVTIYDPSGDETMYNSVVAQTYAIHKAVLALTTDATEMLLNTATPTFHSTITANLNAPAKLMALTTGIVTAIGGGVSAVTGSLLYKRSGLGIQLHSNAITATITGNPTEVRIDLNSMMPGGVTPSGIFFGTATNGSYTYFVTAEMGAFNILSIKSTYALNAGFNYFVTGATSFSFTSFLSFI